VTEKETANWLNLALSRGIKKKLFDLEDGRSFGS
jgi:hypothetical protein